LGAAAIIAVSAGRASAGGRSTGTVPPGIGTVRNSAAMARPEGVCCTHGSSCPRRKSEPQSARPTAARIGLPDLNRHLLGADIVGDVLGRELHGVPAGRKIARDYNLTGVRFGGAVPVKRYRQRAVNPRRNGARITG